MLHNRKNILPISLAAIVLIAGSTLVLLQANHITHFFESASDKQQRQQQAYNNQRKENAIENNGNPNNTAKGQSDTSTYTPPNKASNIIITPSRPSAGQIVISTKLVGYSDGTCKLDIHNGSSATSQSAQVIYAPNYSTCAGFSVPTATLGTGTWNITLTVTSDGVSTQQTTAFGVK